MADINPNIWVYPRVSVNPASFPEIMFEKKKLKYHAPLLGSHILQELIY